MESFQKLSEIGRGKTSSQDSIFQLLSSLYNEDTIAYTQDIEKTSWETFKEIERKKSCL